MPYVPAYLLLEAAAAIEGAHPDAEYRLVRVVEQEVIA